MSSKPQPNAILVGMIPALSADFPPFVPRRGLSNGHLQTIVANYFPRPAFRLPSRSGEVEVDPVDGSRVFATAIGSRSRCARRA